MKIEMLNVGWFTTVAGLWRKDEEDPERRVRFPVPAYLIETERERILDRHRDHPGAAADAEGHYGAGSIAFFELEQEESLAEQVDLDTADPRRAHPPALRPRRRPGADSRLGAGRRPARRVGGRPGSRRRSSATSSSRATTRTPRPTWSSSTATTTCSATARSSCSARPVTPPATNRCGSGTLCSAPTSPTSPSALDDRRFPPSPTTTSAQGRSADRLRELRDAGLTSGPGTTPMCSSPVP